MTPEMYPEPIAGSCPNRLEARIRELEQANAALTAEREHLEKQVRIVTLACDLEEDLAERIADAHRQLATEQYTTSSIGRLLDECRKRMAADWCEIGRLQMENNKLTAERDRLRDRLASDRNLRYRAEGLCDDLMSQRDRLRESYHSQCARVVELCEIRERMTAENAALTKENDRLREFVVQFVSLRSMTIVEDPSEPRASVPRSILRQIDAALRREVENGEEHRS